MKQDCEIEYARTDNGQREKSHGDASQKENPVTNRNSYKDIGMLSKHNNNDRAFSKMHKYEESKVQVEDGWMGGQDEES